MTPCSFSNAQISTTPVNHGNPQISDTILKHTNKTWIQNPQHNPIETNHSNPNINQMDKKNTKNKETREGGDKGPGGRRKGEGCLVLRVWARAEAAEILGPTAVMADKSSRGRGRRSWQYRESSSLLKVRVWIFLSLSSPLFEISIVKKLFRFFKKKTTFHAT